MIKARRRSGRFCSATFRRSVIFNVSSLLGGASQARDSATTLPPLEPMSAAPFQDSISPDMAEPHSYTHLIVVCGPCWPGLLQNHNFDIDQYRHCKRIGINLTMVEPLSQWNPFDALIERDSDAAARPDLAFMVKTESIAVLGRCLIRNQEEYGIRQKHIKSLTVSTI